MFICFLPLFVSTQVSDAYVKVLPIVVIFSLQVSDAYVKVLSFIVIFSLNFSFLDIFLFLKNFYSIKCVLLFFILSIG